MSTYLEAGEAADVVTLVGGVAWAAHSPKIQLRSARSMAGHCWVAEGVEPAAASRVLLCPQRAALIVSAEVGPRGLRRAAGLARRRPMGRTRPPGPPEASGTVGLGSIANFEDQAGERAVRRRP